MKIFGYYSSKDYKFVSLISYPLNKILKMISIQFDIL